MIDYLYESTIRRGSGRTTRMLKGIIADAQNPVTVVANDRNHLEFMKKQFTQLGGDLNHVTFVTASNRMSLMGSAAVEYDHFTLERLFAEQGERIAQEIEDAHNNCGHSGDGDDWCECCADRWNMVGNCTCLKAMSIARGQK